YRTLSCPVPLDFTGTPLPGCNREASRSYICGAEASLGLFGETESPTVEVPPGMYLMVGDNRDNSEDGRVWGFVPEDHLVGKATRIWFNWDLQRSGGPAWDRIGMRIE